MGDARARPPLFRCETTTANPLSSTAASTELLPDRISADRSHSSNRRPAVTPIEPPRPPPLYRGFDTTVDLLPAITPTPLSISAGRFAPRAFSLCSLWELAELNKHQIISSFPKASPPPACLRASTVSWASSPSIGYVQNAETLNEMARRDRDTSSADGRLEGTAEINRHRSNLHLFSSDPSLQSSMKLQC